jgi:hypothetical protein
MQLPVQKLSARTDVGDNGRAILPRSGASFVDHLRRMSFSPFPKTARSVVYEDAHRRGSLQSADWLSHT